MHNEVGGYVGLSKRQCLLTAPKTWDVVAAVMLQSTGNNLITDRNP